MSPMRSGSPSKRHDKQGGCFTSRTFFLLVTAQKQGLEAITGRGWQWGRPTQHEGRDGCGPAGGWDCPRPAPSKQADEVGGLIAPAPSNFKCDDGKPAAEGAAEHGFFSPGPPRKRGVQVAVDITLVSPVEHNGQARPGCEAVPGRRSSKRQRVSDARTVPELRLDSRGRFGTEALDSIQRLARRRSMELWCSRACVWVSLRWRR